ncbi:MAG: alanine--tRNA ligase, partial [bacterium]|nr:alanine--tRNA ligase [Candidatus Kapabacteria bacterium]
MTSRETRQSFLDFFRERGHTIVPSAPVIPHGDPTLYFTNAGMNQFKDVFLGVGSRDFKRAADTQKCIRVSGKHNDLEEVGHDTYHQTFFEMLGNWSFGDYYKAEAIAWAWELLTVVWKLDPKRLHVTVFAADDGSDRDQESHDIWLRQPMMDPTHIHWAGAKDNFWEMGETGPCGPCTEIHFDRTADLSGGPLVNVGVPEVIEIWNNVFIQYNRNADGTLDDLPAKHVDTGMGFERVCAVLQGVDSNYDTDVFAPLIKVIETISGGRYVNELDDRASIAMRVIADHVRALTFAIADGASPGNTGRGYVLRRLLRRAVKYAFIDLDVKQPILHKLVDVLVETMGDVFPEIVRQRDYIEKIIRAEEESFGRTLDEGVRKFESLASGRVQSATDNGSHGGASQSIVPADDAFLLFDTFGFPLDLTQLMAREKGMEVDVAGFDRLMQQQKTRARDARRSVLQEASGEQIDSITNFIGYENTSGDASVVAIAAGGVVLDRTPFYAEMGGQVADHGDIVIAGERYHVSDVQKLGAAFIHVVDADELIVESGERVFAEIDRARRDEIQRNHSATHLLHEALRRVLGGHVQQAGSLVTPGHLRFDFSHFQKVNEEDLQTIEAMVNAKVREGVVVATEEISIESARKIPNVKMFFGDKYGSLVRVVTIDPAFSVELCGGTHVTNIADVGIVKITSESSIQSGVRRIEAVTGRSADELLLERYREIDRLSHRLGVSDRDLYAKVEQLLEDRKLLERELAEA